jgi:hypothetical protein
VVEQIGDIAKVDPVLSEVLPVLLFIPHERYAYSVYTKCSYVKGFRGPALKLSFNGGIHRQLLSRGSSSVTSVAEERLILPGVQCAIVVLKFAFCVATDRDTVVKYRF